MRSTANTVPLKRWNQEVPFLRCFCCDSTEVSSWGTSKDLCGVRDPSGVEEPFTPGDFCRMLDMLPEHSRRMLSAVALMKVSLGAYSSLSKFCVAAKAGVGIGCI